MSCRASQLCLTLLLASYFVGCQSAKVPDLVPIKGTLFYESGTPLANFGVVLVDEQGSFRQGFTDANGVLTLECAKGRYKVTLGDSLQRPPPTPIKDDDPNKGKPKEMIISDPVEHPYPRYRSVETTPWTIDVPEGGLQGFTLKMKNG